MNDEETYRHWEQHVENYRKECIKWLKTVLFDTNGDSMRQLFAEQGFKLGNYMQDVHQLILRAYIQGETTLDHVRLFFNNLGGSYFTNKERSMNVWGEIVWIETRNSSVPTDFNQFILKFVRIYNLVRCLALEFKMPLNPTAKFAHMNSSSALEHAAFIGSWMTYWCMASFYPDKLLPKETLDADQYLQPHMLKFWIESGLLAPDGRIECGKLDRFALQVIEADRLDLDSRRKAFHDGTDQLVAMLGGTNILQEAEEDWLHD